MTAIHNHSCQLPPPPTPFQPNHHLPMMEYETFKFCPLLVIPPPIRTSLHFPLQNSTPQV